MILAKFIIVLCVYMATQMLTFSIDLNITVTYFSYSGLVGQANW